MDKAKNTKHNKTATSASEPNTAAQGHQPNAEPASMTNTTAMSRHNASATTRLLPTELASSTAQSADEPSVCICSGCNQAVKVAALKEKEYASCPRCSTLLYTSRPNNIVANTAIALTCLILFIPSHFYDFLSIRLLGTKITASIFGGFTQLFENGYFSIAFLCLFCSSIAPLLMCTSVVTAHLGLKFRHFNLLKRSLSALHYLKQWVMIDVFLASIAISSLKLKDYADINIETGLYTLVFLQLGVILLLTRLRIEGYWDQWKAGTSYGFEHFEIECEHCHLTQPSGHYCRRCFATLHSIKPNSLVRTSCFLLTAIFFVVPANVLPISAFMVNGQETRDTIFSGVATLFASGMGGIGLIIFIASIVVPIGKIIGLSYLLIAIKFNLHKQQARQMQLFKLIHWIGKWSIMDLFVITIMTLLIARTHLLEFTPGPGAIAFAAVVVFTLFATESFDPKLLWQHTIDEETTEKIKSELTHEQ